MNKKTNRQKIKSLSDNKLLDEVQRKTIRYFWEFSHPISGMARERSNPVKEYDYKNTVTTGGTGFGIMAILTGVSRGWIPYEEALQKILDLTKFLKQSQTHHGAFPHHMDGRTGKTIPFVNTKDNGGDIVETSFLIMGLLCARQYFQKDKNAKELCMSINELWHNVEWDFYTNNTHNLYWHWSQGSGFDMGLKVKGWDETLITILLATASPKHPISTDVYKKSWTNSLHYKNGEYKKGVKLPLGPPNGGPLFFSQYSFMGLDPRGLKDKNANYWEQNYAHTLFNRNHCIENPHGYKGYGSNCWGLTSSDSDKGYGAHSPTHDTGVISPTAALSSFPYTPKFSMEALKHFYNNMRDKLWSQYGFVDAFNESSGWYANSHLAIDQGPIVVMIENYRSGLLWDLFMSCPEIKNGLRDLGFSSPHLKPINSVKNDPQKPTAPKTI